jgi:hypothetical protein
LFYRQTAAVRGVVAGLCCATFFIGLWIVHLRLKRAKPSIVLTSFKKTEMIFAKKVHRENGDGIKNHAMENSEYKNNDN